ncbi:hypothetical protein LOTGIDRAFT_167509 [Lottia gigantea]|uniref:Metalloendopeptidase n=1 Tax=Lottia gigantea TaxID=225164 RepID=V3ZTW4_LOTGI|nr:hypothetical protein LOTGIDRAFT_167509 [Lottia gigantea]ESO86005.1 hypothetical protein LOTGIDRAFT_167509 [Lottia gigantea]
MDKRCVWMLVVSLLIFRLDLIYSSPVKLLVDNSLSDNSNSDKLLSDELLSDDSEIMVGPDDIHDDQTVEERKVVWSTLQLLETRIARQKHKPIQKNRPVSKTTNLLFEGDIMLRPSEAVEKVEENSERQKRKMTSKDYKMWDFPIPYRFDTKGKAIHDEVEKSHIRKAIRHWEGRTCITFEEVDANYTAMKPVILFKKDIGCWSYVGKEKAFREQEVSIGAGCFNVGTIIHEIGHAIGFWHEQSRPDRDDHVTVLYENVKYGKDYNFVEESWRDVINLGIPYDSGSIMHYKSTEYSYNDQVMTIKTIDPLLQRVLGQRVELSFFDTKLANLAYCNKKCPQALTENNCRHDGYTDPLNCNRCRCPEGLRGAQCETVAPALGEPCGGTLQIEGTETYKITTPGFPYNFRPGQRCYWLIKAKKGKSVYLNVSSKNFMFTPNCSNSTRIPCTEDFLEVKYHTSFGGTGARFCCTVPPNKIIVSEGNEMLVIFRSTSGGYGGFQASVSSESCGGCTTDEPLEQKACVRHVTRSCIQEWQVRVKEECPVFFIPPGADCGGYVNKTMRRKSTCDEEEKYCCGNRKLVDGKCIASQRRIAAPPTTTTQRVKVSNHVVVNYSETNISNDVNVGWSDWTDLTQCSRQCGGCGRKKVRRTCDYPTSCGGKSLEEKTVTCNIEKCKISLVTLCNQVRRVEYRCGLFWPLKTCTRYQSYLSVCQSYCCQGFKQTVNGTCILAT